MIIEEEEKNPKAKMVEKFNDPRSLVEEKADLLQKAEVLKTGMATEEDGIDALLEDDGIDESDVPQVIKDKVTEIEQD